MSRRIVLGSPATKDDYYPRDKISRKLRLALEVEHVLFLGPRRTGKTSVVLDLREKSVIPCIFLDVEQFSHPQLWIEAMVRELSRYTDGAGEQIFKKIKSGLPNLQISLQIQDITATVQSAEKTQPDWRQSADALFAALHKLATPVWFLVDEFPIMIDLIAKQHGVFLAEDTLHWLRSLRQQNTDSPVRFLLSGSIGLDNVLRRHNIRGVGNDFRREELTPLTAEEALKFALSLAEDNHIALQREMAEAYIKRLGPAIFPFFIQLFMAELQNIDIQPADVNETLALVEQIYQSIALSNRNQYADNMRSRLKDMFNEVELYVAKEILGLAAGNASGVSITDIRFHLNNAEAAEVEYVLEVLIHDGYLHRPQQRKYGFYSYLLRDYWLEKEKS